jgi:hypothetical protein
MAASCLSLSLPKTSRFYNNILDPHAANGDVTIDTHAGGAALLRSLGQKAVPVSHNFGTSAGVPGFEGASTSIKTGLHGTYPLYAEAYRQAAKEWASSLGNCNRRSGWYIDRILKGALARRINVAIVLRVVFVERS